MINPTMRQLVNEWRQIEAGLEDAMLRLKDLEDFPGENVSAAARTAKDATFEARAANADLLKALVGIIEEPS